MDSISHIYYFNKQKPFLEISLALSIKTSSQAAFSGVRFGRLCERSAAAIFDLSFRAPKG
jgi:hypothetical protein